MDLFDNISYSTSRLVTTTYSTSFSKAVSNLHPDIRNAVYSIYGFVRLADEIVDTFHQFDKEKLLDKFEADYYDSLHNGISLNPVLHSFSLTVRKYDIPDELIRAFLKSMKIDLEKTEHKTERETKEYIYGSAEVVGLMCLKVFVNGDENLYHELMGPAKMLGSAFQKVNFLRDLKNDTEILNRYYFHIHAGNEFTEEVKNELIVEIGSEFDSAMHGLRKLPANSRLAVLIAFYYYKRLLFKLKRTPASAIMKKRIRVSDPFKLWLLLKAIVANRLNLL